MAEGEGEGGRVILESVAAKENKRNEKWALAKEEEAEALKTKNAAYTRKLIYNRAKKYGLYSKEYEEQQKELIQLKNQTRLKARFPVNPEAKLMLVIRIPGIFAMDPNSRKTLHLFRLRQIFYGVFVKVMRVNIYRLYKVEPYVTIGYPNLKSVKELIYKRGHTKLNNKRTALTDSSIEQALGKHGIHCIEDLIHEIWTVGPHFMEADRFISPFQLELPLSGQEKRRNRYVEGGDAVAGNTEDINELIGRMTVVSMDVESSNLAPQ